METNWGKRLVLKGFVYKLKESKYMNGAVLYESTNDTCYEPYCSSGDTLGSFLIMAGIMFVLLAFSFGWFSK